MNAALAELEEGDVSGVLRWRFLALCAAGYEFDDALELAANANIDLHVACDLVRKGCPVQTALRILV
jgi:hypothetical protein